MNVHNAVRAAFVTAVSVALAVFTSNAAGAQRAAGVVRDSASRAPIPGAVVSALDSAGHVLARSLTGDAGQFSLAFGSGAVRLRTLRIGFQPRDTDVGHVAAAPLDIVMTRSPTLLTAVAVHERGICASGESDAAAGNLWEHARAALLASVVAREALPARAHTWTWQRTLDAESGLVLSQVGRRRSGQTTRPFVAPEAPQALAERGYTEVDGDVVRFKAPDADVLLDDSFAATHCFTVRQGDATHLGTIGLAFTPAPGRDALVDVRGTLWIANGNPELRSLEFTYVRRERAFELDSARGTLHFHTMPNGVSFVSDWMLRLPVFEAVRSRRATGVVHLEDRTSGERANQPRIVQIGEAGGQVESARWDSGASWQATTTAFTGTVVERGNKTPVAGAVVVIRGSADSARTDSLGQFSIRSMLPGRYNVDVVDTALSAFFEPRSAAATITLREENGPRVHLDVPGQQEALRTLCGTGTGPATGVLLARVDGLMDGNAPKGMKVSASWLKDASTTQQETQAVELDARGRFSLCGVPSERVVHLALESASRRHADTTVMLGSSTVTTMVWHATLDASPNGAQLAAGLRGRVVRADDGAPVSGAEVWAPLLDRRTVTDANGDFQLGDLRAGATLIQVRRIGFAVVRDTAMVGTASSRAFRLVAQASQLDTVRTIASQRRLLSPNLRAFEDRRLAASAGFFIADSTLREHDDETLASIALSRLAGVRLTPGRSGALYFASSRKACAGQVLTPGTNCKPCYSTIYMDGVRIYSVNDNSPEPPDMSRINVNELAGVEYYQSGTGPASYNATVSGCGTLLLWRRER